jgi:hypothetical protein
MPCNSDKSAAILVAAAVTLSRIPFLTRSYGYDGDGWVVAATARRIAEEGKYVYSRPPGYPLQELICSIFWKAGPLALNGLTALFSVAAAVFFFLILRALGIPRRDGVLGAIALAFVPMIYINSTATLDYIWALAFLLASLYGVLRERVTIAGVAAGAAIGCRITSGAMLIPLGLVLLAAAPEGRRIQAAARFVILALLAGVLCYLPVFLSYGPEFFRFADEPLSMRLRTRLILYGLTLGVWGLLGTVALVVLFAGFLIKRKNIVRPHLHGIASSKPFAAAITIAITLYVISFARLPIEWAYLIPIVPFVLLLVYRSAPPGWTSIFSIVLMISPFLITVNLQGNVSLPGPLLVDSKQKSEQLDSIKEVYTHINACPTDIVILETGPEIHRFLATPPGSNGWEWEKEVSFTLTLPHRERRQKASETTTVFTLIKEKHRYIGAFVHFKDKNGKVRMRVEKFQGK